MAKKSEIPEAIEDYANLALTHYSHLWRDLMSNAEAEARSGEIRLSGKGSSIPEFLTPTMRNWYIRHIVPLRRPAISAVANMFARLSDEQSGDPIFLEATLDEIDSRREAEKRSAQVRFRQANLAEYTRLDGYRAGSLRANRKYATLVERHEREAKFPSWWYVPILVLIGIFEAAINFESFEQIRWMTPIAALGTTGVIALALAFSSHFHGLFLKQFEATMGPQREDGSRAAAWRTFGLGSIALGCVLGAVGYARWQLLQDLFLEWRTFGGDAPSSFWVIGGSLLANMVVWITGVIVAYNVHDEDPEFPKAYRDREFNDNAYRKQDAKLSGQLRRLHERIDAQADQKLRQARVQDNSMSMRPGYADSRAAFQHVEKKDAQVVAALEAYKAILAPFLSQNGTIIKVEDDIDAEQLEEIDLSSFQSKQMRLKFNSG